MVILTPLLEQQGVEKKVLSETIHCVFSTFSSGYCVQSSLKISEAIEACCLPHQLFEFVFYFTVLY